MANPTSFIFPLRHHVEGKHCDFTSTGYIIIFNFTMKLLLSHWEMMVFQCVLYNNCWCYIAETFIVHRFLVELWRLKWGLQLNYDYKHLDFDPDHKTMLYHKFIKSSTICLCTDYFNINIIHVLVIHNFRLLLLCI